MPAASPVCPIALPAPCASSPPSLLLPSTSTQLTHHSRALPPRSRSLMCHLRPGEDLEKELTDKLKPEELKALLASAHKPNYTVQVGAAGR